MRDQFSFIKPNHQVIKQHYLNLSSSPRKMENKGKTNKYLTFSEIMKSMRGILVKILSKLWCGEEIKDKELEQNTPLMIEVYKSFLEKKFKNTFCQGHLGILQQLKDL